MTLDRPTFSAALAAVPAIRGARAAEPGVLRIGYRTNVILVAAELRAIADRFHAPKPIRSADAVRTAPSAPAQ